MMADIAHPVGLIASRAVLFKECLTEEYQEYQRQVAKNAVALADQLKKRGLRLISDGTEANLASGIRIGSPALTTRGFMEEDMRQVADWLVDTLQYNENPEKLDKIRKAVTEKAKQYQMFADKWNVK